MPYTNILTVRDKNGNEFEIPVLRGPQGTPGAKGDKGDPGDLLAVDQNTGEHILFWVGTREEYESIPEDELLVNCVYYITDDTRDDFNTRLNALMQRVTTLENNAEHILTDVYPVGSFYISANATNPAQLFGGTWKQIGGRFLVGVGATDKSNTNSSYGAYASGSRLALTADETGGEVKHTLLTSELAKHTHTQNAHTHIQNAHTHTQNAHAHNFRDTGGGSELLTWGANAGKLHWRTGGSTPSGGSNYPYVSMNQEMLGYLNGAAPTIATNQNTTAVNQSTTAINNPTGDNTPHNNIPPYLSVYMWQRTA